MFWNITELLTGLIGKNTIYQRYYTDSKLLDMANCKTCTNILLVVENAILMRYYSQTVKQGPYTNLQMDLLGDLLKTRPMGIG
jgi:hypothetical protein